MKKKVANIDGLLNKLTNVGATYNQMKEEFGLTQWGARKIGEHPDTIEKQEVGNHEKLYFAAAGRNKELSELEVPIQDDEVNHEEEIRQTSSTKQTITNKANKYLTKLEKEVKNTETPETEYNPPETECGNATAIIHETDPHFSAYVKNRAGEVVYDTETAQQATLDALQWYVDEIDYQRISGREIDEIVLMLGGDLVEGEKIYEGQAHKIEDTLEDQISAARSTYFKFIKELRSGYDAPLKVVCVSGNHGDIPGTGSGANADDIIYSMLEDMIDLSDISNVKFVKSDRSDYTTFNYRGGKWQGYLTHGENRSNHIGTSSPQSDWLAIKENIGFDAAWRGHYHMQKQENVNGAPVYMTNSRKPADDYTDTIAAFGQTGNAIYFATDDEPVAEVRTQTEVL